MTQWYGAVVGALAATVLFIVLRELRKRVHRRGRHRPRGYEPLFQAQRNGRVRFHLEDLRRSADPAGARGPRPGLEHTIPDLEMTVPDLRIHGVPRQQRDHPDK